MFVGVKDHHTLGHVSLIVWLSVWKEQIGSVYPCRWLNDNDVNNEGALFQVTAYYTLMSCCRCRIINYAWKINKYPLPLMFINYRVGEKEPSRI